MAVPCLRRVAASLGALLLAAAVAHADTFRGAYFDRTSNELVITLAYQGTNPNHRFRIHWGPCHTGAAGLPSRVDANILDDQFLDAARQDFQTVARLSLADMPCRRPARVTLYTAPRNYLVLLIPP